MINKYSIVILITFFFNNAVYSAGTDSTSSGAKSDGRQDNTYLKVTNSNYKKGLDALKQAKKYAKKDKKNKAKKRFNDAIKFFTLSNRENPKNPNILNYLGFSFQKVGDFIMAEIYYNEGLDIDPEHVGINEYLGELYVETNRINLAKERLEILKNCNCEEYKELAEVINNK
jgi:tetratricopeptide (TPR) repeat protein